MPSNDEWETLVDFVGGSKTAGKYLKSKSGWLENGNGENKYGFSALPGGYGDSEGDFGDFDGSGYWWSSTERNSDYAYLRNIYYNYELVFNPIINNIKLLSVRCVQD